MTRRQRGRPTYGEVIKGLRREKGWSQTDLISEIKELCKPGDREWVLLNLQTLKRAEKGGPIDLRSVRSIAGALGVPPRTIAEVDGADVPLSNYDCMLDIVRWDRVRGGAGHLIMDAIAIDLSPAGERMLAAINTMASRAITMRVLAITDNANLLGDAAPPAVVAWTRSVAANLARLEREFDGYTGNKRVVIQVKQYAEIPMVHGIKVGGPPARYYVSECKYTEDPIPIYDWGEAEYHLVPETGPPGQHHALRVKFDAAFTRLWSATNRCIIDRSLGAGSYTE